MIMVPVTPQIPTPAFLKESGEQLPVMPDVSSEPAPVQELAPVEALPLGSASSDKPRSVLTTS
jgi:hypothetical protein